MHWLPDCGHRDDDTHPHLMQLHRVASRDFVTSVASFCVAATMTPARIAHLHLVNTDAQKRHQ